MLWLQYFCMAYPWYFYITWLPKYLQDGAARPGGRGGLSRRFPLVLRRFGQFLRRRGVPAARNVRRRTARVRRSMAITGFFAAGILLVLSTYLENPWLAMVAMGASSFSNDLAMPPSWAACMDVGGKYAGSLAGSMNMMGNFGGMVGPLVLPFLNSMTGNNWNVTFWVSGAVYAIGGVAWFFIDPVTPLDRDEA